MSDINSEPVYLYPVDELDKYIEQINQGITPMLNDQLKREIDLRYKELSNQLFDDDDEIDQDVIEQQKIVKKAIEKKKREASKNDILVIKLSDEQKEKLKDDMSVSLVRKDPNDRYNLPDDQLYSSEEKKIIETKLSRLKHCYYNQTDYVNAIKIIQEAVAYSLRTDYPWMSEQEAIDAFNRGEIKFKWGSLPKLYINYSTQITDKEILKGVVTGQVTLKDRSEDENQLRRKKKNKDQEGVEIPYAITTKHDYDEMAKLHSMGYDTPMSLAFKSKSKIYNRLSMPYGFGYDNNTNNDKPAIEFDWTREGAGEEYFNLMHGIKSSPSDIIRYVNDQNNKSLNNVVIQNANEFLRSMKYSDGSTDGLYGDNGYTRDGNRIQGEYNVNPHAAAVEKNILESIRMNNLR